MKVKSIPAVSAVLLWAFCVCAAPAEVNQTPAPAEILKMRDGAPNVIEKLEAGEPVAIAWFGGSITAANPGWRPQTESWFREMWPNSEITAVDAAIGGTGSELGAFRVGSDVISAAPDLVFIEFAVNDTGFSIDGVGKSMEGILRQIWRAKPETDVLFVYTYRDSFVDETRRRLSPPSVSVTEYLADFYGVPSVNFVIPAVNLEERGNLVFHASDPDAEGKIQLTADGIHPTEEGHKIYTEAVQRSFLNIQKEYDAGFLPSRKRVNDARIEKLQGAFLNGNLEDAGMAPLEDSMLTGNDWKEEENLHPYFKGRMGKIMDGNTPGDAVSFRFKGSYAALYTVIGPDGAKVDLTVDGDEKGTCELFDQYCDGHRIAVIPIASGLDPEQVHSVTVTINPEEPDRTPAVQNYPDPEKELEKEKYHGHHLRVSRILLRGEILPAE